MKTTLLILTLMCNAVCKGQDIIIKKDTTINGTWVIPLTTILRFETGGFIGGNGKISGGIIQAALTQHIFDTSLTVNPSAVYGRDFSCAWFGAKTTNSDNFSSIQKSINTCVANNITNCFLPKGVYNFSQTLCIFYLYKGLYAGVGLHFYGESDFWVDRTVLNFYALQGTAFGVQLGKGTEVDHITIKGLFTAPMATGINYYNTQLKDYGQDGLYGFVIDYDGSKNSSGSTGCKFHDMKVSGFTYLYSVSPSAATYNGDILSFTNITCGEGRVGFQSNQAQEKNNLIDGIYSWGKLHTLIQIGQSGKYQAGNYIITRGNIAGQCIRLFDIRQSGWYSSSISNIFAESIGTIGNLTTGDSRTTPPLSVTNSIFHFAPITISGVQTLLTSNSLAINFSNCTMRYYGLSDTMKFSGLASFTNCTFSGAVVNAIPGSKIN